MMQGVNEYFNLGLTTEDMEQRVAKFGADCAFFIKNTPAYATGIGDKLSPINLSLKDKYILLVKPDVFVSTKEAYAHVTPRPADYPLLKAIEQPIECWRERIVNDFEQSVFPNHPELAAIKQTLYDMGALYAAMSGSGSTLFGLFDRPIDEAKKVFSQHFVFMQKLVRWYFTFQVRAIRCTWRKNWQWRWTTPCTTWHRVNLCRRWPTAKALALSSPFMHGDCRV